MKRLYFVRHGESEFNKAHKWTGSTDSPLTDKGHAQAKKAGQNLREQGLEVDIILTSPLTRAHQTAHHIASALEYPLENIKVHPSLIERNFGDLEGRKDLVTATRYLLDESAIDDFPNVESLEALQKRADQILEELHNLPHETVLVVGHGAFGRALRRSITKKPLHVRGKTFSNAEAARLL